MILPELVDGCNLKCALCWNRNRTGSNVQMDYSVVARVLEVYGNSKQEIAWFNWGEPMLYRKFEKLASMVQGTKSSISSNFSLKIPDKKIEALKNFNKVIISISGVTQDIYQIYHCGGKLDIVKANLKKLSEVGANRIIFRWLAHKQNNHQVEEAKVFAKELGAEFEFTPITYDVEDLLRSVNDNEFPYNLTETVSRNRSSCKIINRTPIDVHGNYLLCCATHNVKIGPTIFDTVTPEELVEARKNNRICKRCQKRGCWSIF